MSLGAQLFISPAEADGDWARVGGDAITAAVQVAELRIEFDVGMNLARDATAEVRAELILARVEKVAVDRKTRGPARSPPQKEAIASLSWDGG